MDAAGSHESQGVDASEAWQAIYAAPAFDLDPLTSLELDALFHGEPEADLCERMLVSTARVRGAIDVELAEGLHALRQGDRLAQLGCHLDDYAREVLDLGKRAADGLAALGAALRTRPYLREALRSGRVRLRAAETVLPVAVGEREEEWVERAARCTTRELEEAVRRARADAPEPEEDWLRLRVHLSPGERLVVDAALELAGEVMPGSSRMEQLEALAQEALGSVPGSVRADVPDSSDVGEASVRLDPAFRPIGPGEATRRAALEAEMERWAALPAVPDCPAPDVRFYETATAAEIDRRLRALGRVRSEWDAILGHCAQAVKQSRLHALLGFTSFRHYVEERLGLSCRAVEQRAALEQQIWRSPPLQEARRQGLSYERLRWLARLPEEEIGSWIVRAKALTCIALRRRVEGETERHLRASDRMGVSMPRRIAVALSAAIEAARKLAGCVLPSGKCLTLLAKHFLDVWQPLIKRSRTRSRKVRDRDEGHCQVPGCSHRAAHSHHVLYRSQRGGDELDNQIAACAFHHLRCIHGGFLRVFGRAPDDLTWLLGGREWNGPGSER